MTQDNRLSGAERELESVLNSLVPAAVRSDPVHSAYQSLRRADRRRVRIWQGVSLMATAACVLVWLPPGQLGSKSNAVVPGESVTAGNAVARVVPAIDQDTAKAEQMVMDRGSDGLPPLRLPDFSNSNSDGTIW
jgi:ferric-dicitrate binding protein FerR (iron transport regulator)